MVALETHYEVLGVDHHSTAEQVKAAYQELVLSLHPDKAGPGSQQRFQLLQQAWQTLRDPATRALYDHQLSQAQLKATVVLHDEIELDEMDRTQQPDEAQSSTSPCQYTYACRCGDLYVLTTTDMQLAAQTHQIIIPCRSCSNHILVKLPL